MIEVIASSSGPVIQIAAGVVLTAVAGFFGRSWRSERVERQKLAAEAQKVGADTAQSEADTVRKLLEGASTIAGWRREELDDAKRRIGQLEESLSLANKRLVECEKHSEIIEHLTGEVEDLRQRYEGEHVRAERYLSERNEARDELRIVKLELTGAKQEIALMSERLDRLEHPST